jgi:hypothetical protein
LAVTVGQVSTPENVFLVFSCELDDGRCDAFSITLSEVRLSSFVTEATTGLLYQQRTIDDDYYGVIGGMKIGRRTEVLGENLP